MWQGIEGHDSVVELFRTAISRNRVAGTYLFIGPAGIGKRTFALKLAKTLLCLNKPPEEMSPCNVCDSCKQVDAGSHPDVIQIAKPKDKANIPISMFIGEEDKRMREGMLYELGLKPFLGGRKVAVIDDADLMRVEGANSLLKTLEEPPPKALIVLIGTSADRQLPTICSRSQWVRFAPLPEELVARLLVSQGVLEDPQQAQQVARFSEGSLTRAVELADPDLWTFRHRLLEHLTTPHLDSVKFAGEFAEFVDSAGKEAAARRARLRKLLAFAVDFYRQLLRLQCGTSPSADPELSRPALTAISRWPHAVETTSAVIDRCLEALTHIERNVNPSILMESWLDDLAALTTKLPAKT